jgi:signal peptidase I
MAARMECGVASQRNMNRTRLTGILKLTAGVISLAFVMAVVGLVVVPRALGLQEAAVLSSSMEPAVPNGGLALIAPLSGSVPAAGEIIAFPRPDEDHSVVARRVFVITDHLGGPTIWTKADAAAAPDPWALRPDQVTGRVKYTIPHAGTVARWLHTPFGFILAVGVPLGLMSLLVLDLFSGQRQNRDTTQTLVESRLRNAFRG